MDKARTVVLSVYLSPSLEPEKILDALEAEAKRSERSLNWLVARILRDYARARPAKTEKGKR